VRFAPGARRCDFSGDAFLPSGEVIFCHPSQRVGSLWCQAALPTRPLLCSCDFDHVQRVCSAPPPPITDNELLSPPLLLFCHSLSLSLSFSLSLSLRFVYAGHLAQELIEKETSDVAMKKVADAMKKGSEGKAFCFVQCCK